jgi:hypothetical protein
LVDRDARRNGIRHGSRIRDGLRSDHGVRATRAAWLLSGMVRAVRRRRCLRHCGSRQATTLVRRCSAPGGFQSLCCFPVQCSGAPCWRS